MFSLNAKKEDVAQLIASMSDEDYSRFLYCQRMASTFMAVHLFEHSVIQAMLMCDRVKVNKALGPDAKKWQHMLFKQEELNGSTLGNLSACPVLAMRRSPSKPNGILPKGSPPLRQGAARF